MKTFQPDWLLFFWRFLFARRQIYAITVIWTGRSTTPRVWHRGQHQQHYAYQRTEGSNILMRSIYKCWIIFSCAEMFQAVYKSSLRTISSTTRALPPMSMIVNRTRSSGEGGVQPELHGHGWQGSPGQNIVTSLVSAWKSETRLQVQGVSNKCSIFYFCERKKLDTSCAAEVFVNLADHAFDEISKNSVPPLVNLSQLTTVRTSLGNAGIIKCLVESNMADK